MSKCFIFLKQQKEVTFEITNKLSQFRIFLKSKYFVFFYFEVVHIVSKEIVLVSKYVGKYLKREMPMYRKVSWEAELLFLSLPRDRAVILHFRTHFNLYQSLLYTETNILYGDKKVPRVQLASKQSSVLVISQWNPISIFTLFNNLKMQAIINSVNFGIREAQ